MSWKESVRGQGEAPETPSTLNDGLNCLRTRQGPWVVRAAMEL